MEEFTSVKDEGKSNKRNPNCSSWLFKFCQRCHDEPSTSSWEPRGWSRIFPFPYFPTYRQTAQTFCIIIFFLLTWGIFYVEIGEPVTLPGQLFLTAVLVIASYLVGYLWMKITTLPALIGMLLTGIVIRNLGLISLTDDFRKLNQDLRKIALVIILMRAGLGLKASVLRKHYAAVLQLGLVPWLVECVTIAISSYYLLYLPWIWGFLLGSMIASVSPAVVVPCLFRLREEGYGEAKGIPTILLASAAIDDSVSVAVFTIILDAMFSDVSFTFNIIKGPLSIVIGAVIGVAWGAMASIVPEKGDTYVVLLRFLMLFLGGLFSLFMSNFIGWSGAGPLTIVSSGFVAAYFWDKQGWSINKNPVSEVFRILWIFFEPILFALTGAQISINSIDLNIILTGLICLVSCLILRIIVTILVSFGCGLNVKEKLFIGLTWVAKATVQAALGPAALDLIKNGETTGEPIEKQKQFAQIILTMSVLSVVLSAPLGAILIALTGPRLLKSNKQKKKMNKIKDNWFSESCDMWPGGTFSFEVERVLYSEKSQFQDIMVCDTTSFGRVLVLDGIIQCTEKDEFSYQEMISFLPLCCHRNPERVLIVGGGDGGVAREVAKHPQVKEIVQVEIDEKVIEVSKKFLPFMAVGFESPKLTLHVGDGFEFMKNHSNEFDVIITDSSDPVGPAVNLFQENYFSLMKSALKPNGVVCSQAGTIWNDIELVSSTLKFCRNQFPSAAYAYCSVPTYPSGQIGFVIGSLDKDIKFDTPQITFSREDEKAMNLRYYNSDIHKASFVLPTFVKYHLA